MLRYLPSPSLLLACVALILLPVPALADDDERLSVVASFSILADIAQHIGGDRISVQALVGPDEDAHAYQPRPSDARQVRDADLLIANGLGFDTWLERLALSAGRTRPLVLASDGVAAIPHTGHAHHGHDHGALDPHAWQDVSHVRVYARNIAVALSAADEEHASYYHDRLAYYDAQLAQLDADIRAQVERIPPARRTVVTSHDAFGYFAAAYGLRFVPATGVSEQAETSAAGMARLIRQLREEAVPVVFIENISDSRLGERIAQESNAALGGTLYSDALSASDGPAATYVDMMRANLRTLTRPLLDDAGE